MTRSSNQKMKPLYLEKILYEQTDDDHPLNALEIAEALAAYDVPASRKSIYDDIDALRQYGLDIEHRGGKDGGYFVATREFELAELKLLVDAVQSSHLVTGRKCTELIKKLSQLASKAQGKQLNRQVYTARQARAMNETVFYSIDAIHSAINEGKQISFKYFDYNVKKKRVYRKKGEPYVRTPVAMCWNDDCYYLITYSPSYDDHFANFRVDRMADVRILEKEADKFEREDFNIADYVKRSFGMYSGEIVEARLAFNETLVNAVLDHFGSDTRLTEAGDGWFSIKVEVSASPVFLSWIFQFGNKAKIIAPNSLREAMRDLIATNADIYNNA
jgi:predicted DNA-binding transcriptional regulator YafY